MAIFSTVAVAVGVGADAAVVGGAAGGLLPPHAATSSGTATSACRRLIGPPAYTHGCAEDVRPATESVDSSVDCQPVHARDIPLDDARSLIARGIDKAED